MIPEANPGNGESAELVVLIEDEKGAQITAKLQEAGENSLTLRCDGESPPPLPITHRTSVSFMYGKTCVNMYGRVIDRRDSKGSISYQIEVNCEHIPDLKAMVFRRNAFRVKPARDKPVAVLISTQGCREPLTAQLKDISRTGLSIEVTPSAESKLFRSSRLQLGFELPDDDEPFSLEGIVRYRRLIGAHVRYGLQFDHLDPSVIDALEERLLKYIYSRQVQVIQALKHIASAG